jgi:tRNA dimethylallyltransferase
MMKIAILGPTASGKSGLAVAVARRVGGTVINGDPFQAIAGLAIGTGQPSEAERGDVPHVGYGLLPLSTRPNPAQFGEQVRRWLAPVHTPVLVTGSGLYLRGIWEQLTDLPEVPEATVTRVRRWSEVLGVPRLHRVLTGLDSKRAAELHPNDGSRVNRALALHLATGLKASELLTGVRAGIPEGWRVLVVLSTREMQRKRVEMRVAEQLKTGWQDEVARLLLAGHREDLEALRPLGYLELMKMTGGSPRSPRNSHLGIERIVQETQAFAKRQATWFRNQLPEAPHWDPDAEPLAAAFEKLGIS